MGEIPRQEEGENENKIELRRVKEVTDPRSRHSVKKLKPGVTFRSSDPPEEQDGTYFEYDLSPEETSVKDFLENLPSLDVTNLGPNKNGTCTLDYKAKKHVLDIMIEQGKEHEYRSKEGRWQKYPGGAMRVGVGEVKPLGQEIWRSGVVLNIDAYSKQDPYGDDNEETDYEHLQDLIKDDMESEEMAEAIEKNIKKAEEIREKIQGYGIECEIIVSEEAQKSLESYRKREEK